MRVWCFFFKAVWVLEGSSIVQVLSLSRIVGKCWVSVRVCMTWNQNMDFIWQGDNTTLLPCSLTHQCGLRFTRPAWVYQISVGRAEVLTHSAVLTRLCARACGKWGIIVRAHSLVKGSGFFLKWGNLRTGLQNTLILVVVSDLDDVDVNTMCSANKTRDAIM